MQGNIFKHRSRESLYGLQIRLKCSLLIYLGLRKRVILMGIFVSEEYRLGDALESLGVFDSLMDEDSNYFINIKRLKARQAWNHWYE